MKFFLASVALCVGYTVVAQNAADCPPGEVLIGSRCGKCPPGQSYFSYGKYCEMCPVGSFKAGEGRGPCLDCLSKTFALEGASECVSCPEGQALMKNGTCGICEPGSYYNRNTAQCEECYINSFLPSANVRNACFNCAGNSQSPKGSTECTRCPDNKAMMLNGTCAICPAGSHYSQGELKCLKCPIDSFTPEPNLKIHCIACSGDMHANIGATMCTACPDGQALMRDGNCGSCPAGSLWKSRRKVCQKCPPDTFQPRENVAPRCLRCAGNEHSGEGATSCSRCPPNTALMRNGKCRTCPPGKRYDPYTKRCSRCMLNEFQPDENIRSACFSCSGDMFAVRGATECRRCNPDEAFMKDGKCSPCPRGTRFDRYSLRCKRCDYNEYSSGTGVDQTCQTCPRSHYSNRMSDECVACPEGQAMIAKSKELVECGICPPGSFYNRYTAKCKRCERGVSPGGNHELCTECDDGMSPNEEKSDCI